MKAIFIADAHLIDETSPGYAELLNFLEELRLARLEGSKAGGLYADELFILGDFFDFWFARGTRIYPPFEKVLAGLLALKEAGVRIHLAEGNHDFFLADYFSRYLGMEVTPDWAEVKLDRQRILFAHGDVVDSIELSYKLLRGILRSGFFIGCSALSRCQFSLQQPVYSPAQAGNWAGIKRKKWLKNSILLPDRSSRRISTRWCLGIVISHCLNITT